MTLRNIGMIHHYMLSATAWKCIWNLQNYIIFSCVECWLRESD